MFINRKLDRKPTDSVVVQFWQVVDLSELACDSLAIRLQLKTNQIKSTTRNKTVEFCDVKAAQHALLNFE
jgi:hypothetical protein